jgi:hypothetical protein
LAGRQNSKPTPYQKEITMKKPIKYTKVPTSITKLAEYNPRTRRPMDNLPSDLLAEAIDSVNERIALLPTAHQATGDEIRICRLIVEVQRLRGLMTPNSFRVYHNCECDGKGCDAFTMTITVTNKGIAECHCKECGYTHNIDLKEMRSFAVSQKPGKAFFISAQ